MSGKWIQDTGTWTWVINLLTCLQTQKDTYTNTHTRTHTHSSAWWLFHILFSHGLNIFSPYQSLFGRFSTEGLDGSRHGSKRSIGFSKWTQFGTELLQTFNSNSAQIHLYSLVLFYSKRCHKAALQRNGYVSEHNSGKMVETVPHTKSKKLCDEPTILRGTEDPILLWSTPTTQTNNKMDKNNRTKR